MARNTEAVEIRWQKTREALLLSRFAKTVDINCPQPSSRVADCDVMFDPSALKCITARMDVRNIKLYVQQSRSEMYCVVFAVISSFNIDDYTVNPVISFKWFLLSLVNHSFCIPAFSIY
ncbi:hypothetical protein HELRODRAFT_169053 [Helobdella robusta]|uniref:Uncharacterized protein n=1 Tax=Helobdella robusta TaxID=6412 RepID=T1F1B9_HELRO|nr:hypothetical protein HELRODRAFT_169053 [Helobdella robusta]ESO09113.1 hypothetical protein HELRODRAFT_169053 [Helobdella robusta]